MIKFIQSLTPEQKNFIKKGMKLIALTLAGLVATGTIIHIGQNINLSEMVQNFCDENHIINVDKETGKISENPEFILPEDSSETKEDTWDYGILAEGDDEKQEEQQKQEYKYMQENLEAGTIDVRSGLYVYQSSDLTDPHQLDGDFNGLSINNVIIYYTDGSTKNIKKDEYENSTIYLKKIEEIKKEYTVEGKEIERVMGNLVNKDGVPIAWVILDEKYEEQVYTYQGSGKDQIITIDTSADFELE